MTSGYYLGEINTDGLSQFRVVETRYEFIFKYADEHACESAVLYLCVFSDTGAVLKRLSGASDLIIIQTEHAQTALPTSV